jgi:hypothetical protein
MERFLPRPLPELVESHGVKLLSITPQFVRGGNVVRVDADERARWQLRSNGQAKGLAQAAEQRN